MESLLASLAAQTLSNPQFWTEAFKFIEANCHHTAADVGQDILDAYEGGHISREKAQALLNILLSPDRPAPRRRSQLPQQAIAPTTIDLETVIRQFWV